MPDPRRVLVVGLGTIARTHVEVLTSDARVRIVGGVDPDPTVALDAPVHRDLESALDTGPEPDLVVVATPTATHVPLVSMLLDRTDALILSEKPLAADRTALKALHDAAPADALAARVKVAHHFAFSPEVEWARERAGSQPEQAPPTRILAVFNDAYGGLPERQRASVVSSWVDSAPNQLSVVAAFAAGLRVVSHTADTERAVTTLDHDGGRTVLTSNWLAADTSKQTSVEYADGTVLRLDHTSMTGLMLRDGAVVEHVAYAGDVGRKVAHYRGLYDVLLTRPDDLRLGVALATDIARLLDDAAGVAGEVRFGAVGAPGSH